MKSCHAIILLCLFAGCATKEGSPVTAAGGSSRRHGCGEDMPEIRTPETVKAYPVGRYTDPNFPDEMHERHTLYRREQAPTGITVLRSPRRFPLGLSRPSPIRRRPITRKRTPSRSTPSRKPTPRHSLNRTAR